MISIKNYLAKQLNGPRLNTIAQVISTYLEKYEAYFSYLMSISIQTAEEYRLEEIGKIIGYLRPLVPNEYILEGLFRFSSASIAPSYSDIGFASEDGLINGGNFSGLGIVLDSNLLAISQYRKLLKSAARLKNNRLSLSAIDDVCSILGSNYIISYTSINNISVVFSTISYTNLYVAELLFNVMLDTVPRVLVTKL